ncbi:unnamed protein product [Urochloa humidicola]
MPPGDKRPAHRPPVPASLFPTTPFLRHLVCSAAPDKAPLLWPRAWADSSSAAPGINPVDKSAQECYNRRRLLVFSHGSI